MFYNLSAALLSLRPTAKWGLIGNEYEGIIWNEPSEILGGQTKPTIEELLEEDKRLKKIEDNNYYQKLRKNEYPNFLEYLDGIVKGDASQIQAYIDKCNEVKQKYPKPE